MGWQWWLRGGFLGDNLGHRVGGMVETLRCCRPLALLLVVAALPSAPRLLEHSLTYNVDEPTTLDLRPFSATVLQNGPDQLGFWTEGNDFFTWEDNNLHVGAPVHIARGKWAIDAFPLERLWQVPGLTQEATALLGVQDERHGRCAGPVDVGNSTHHAAYQAMHSCRACIVENVANLPQLSATNFLVTLTPTGGDSDASTCIIAEAPEASESHTMHG